MATSTNYLWTEPNDSDLVKNGASAIRTLGNAIDASLWSSGFGQAGKNKIINGDFSINQRNFTSVTADDYGFDRWQAARSGATLTYTPQTFTAGAAPVAGYESKNFARLAVSVGNDLARLQNKIEDVRTFAGQTVTVSFWAKGTNPTTAGNLAVNFAQNFGTGGSPSASVNTAQQTFVLTANWTRYSLTFAIPSISGKTIGTDANSSSLQLWIGQGTSIATDAWTLDLWGVQVEAGSYATPFQTATGTIQGELAACQRYYWRNTSNGTTATQLFTLGVAYSTTAVNLGIQYPVQMRTTPTSIDAANLAVLDVAASRVNVTGAAIDAASNSFDASILLTGASGLTSNRTYYLYNQSGATGYLGLSAEL